MDERSIEKGIAGVLKTYELLDRVRLGKDIVIRDDQFDAEALRDTARLARSKGIGVSLLDTGRFDAAGLDWLLRERVRFYSTDDVARPASELALILKAARRARSFVAYTQNGPLPAETASHGLSLPELLRLVGDGMDIHLTNRTHERDFAVLHELAEAAREGKSHLVYSHHGLLGESCLALVLAGPWFHVSDRSLSDAAALSLAVEVAATARRAGTRAAVYVEQGLPLTILTELFDAGAVLLFHTPPSDRSSLQRPLEQKALRRKLPLRAYWLSTAFLP